MWFCKVIKKFIFVFFFFFFSSALAASGGQLPLSTLEGGSKAIVGASGGQGGALASSLFLNHPTLLHMGQNPGAGLVSGAVAKVSQASPFPSVSSISPTPCSPSPCSSPASSCLSSEMGHSPPSLGGAKIEWPRQRSILEEEAGGYKNLTFSHQSDLFLSFRCSSSIFSFYFLQQLSLFLSQSFNAKNTKNERGERKGKKPKKGKREERGKGKDWNQKVFIYPNRWKGDSMGPFCL